MAEPMRNPISPRRVPRLVLWAAGAVAVAAVAVQVTGTGLDILLLLVVGLVVILLERTLGDWLGEMIGAGFSAVLLGTALLIVAWVSFAPGGLAERFFAAAEKRGYHALYFRPAPVPAKGAAPLPVAVVAPAATAGTTQSADPSRRGGRSAGTPSEPRASQPERPRSDAQPSAEGGRAGRSGRRVGTVTRLQLRQLAHTHEEIVARVQVDSPGGPAAGAVVEFRLGGRLLGTRQTDRDGTASIPFSLRAPGQFRLQAGVVDTPEYRASSTAATVQILPRP